MESRKITVIDTRINGTKVFESTAETMAEMLNDFRANGIDATGMAIQEGLTKTELNEHSQLPHDVLYRGAVTNNLVFRLTQKNKNIASGMDRKEVYDIIKELNLSNVIKEAFGRSFTQVATSDLENIINSAKANTEKATEEEEFSCDIEEALLYLVDILCENCVISCKQANKIIGMVQKGDHSIYSNDEIKEMFEKMD